MRKILIFSMIVILLLTISPMESNANQTTSHHFATRVIEYSGSGNTALILGGPRGEGAYQGSTHVLSLGDSGYVTVGFDVAITNGPGPDFIVFENPFYIYGGSGAVFAELAYVEVSTDGVNFARFPSVSLTQQGQQMFPENIENLAGVHPVYANVDENNIDPCDPAVAGGDAFDLNDLLDHPSVQSGLVDLSHINFVKLIDIYGDGSCLDSLGNPIYDPTGYGSSGSDFDAVSVINYEPGENNSPETPTKPSGSTYGVTGTSYTYSTSAIDPDNDQVQYRFDWDANGDHDYSSWTTLDESGHTGSLSHSWSNAGRYEVKAQAKDVYGDTSSWSNSIIVNIDKKNDNIIIDEWTGSIRIEGKNDTIWDGTVTVGETYFYAKNVETGETQEYHISFPSALGALIEASDIAGFSYFIEYWPIWNAFLVKTIENDSDWWQYWVDYELPMVGAGDYELTDQDTMILWGYLENWYVHALRISVDKNEVKKNEKFTVSVFNETMSGVGGATVHVGQETYTTDENGNVTVSCGTGGIYKIYAEKDGFVRSEKISIKVKKNVMTTKPIDNGFYLMNLKLFNNLKKTWIIGPIDIEVEASEDIDKVDFYINDVLVFSGDERPFEYRLNEKAFLKKTEIIVKSYSIEILSHKNLFNNILKILEKIKSTYDKNDLKTRLESYFNHFEKTIFKEEDIDTKEVIITNLFPNLHK